MRKMRVAPSRSRGSIVSCNASTLTTSSGCLPKGFVVRVASRCTITSGGAVSRMTASIWS
jgi:hypothetical protein